MLRNYLVTTFRSLTRHKTYVLMTLLGLTAGFASSLLILQYVRYELSYDQDLPNVEHIAQFSTRFDNPGRDPIFITGAPGPAHNVLAPAFPEIDVTTRVYAQTYLIKRGQDVFREPGIRMVDPEFFDVFDLQIVKGTRSGALDTNHSVLLSESAAKKYFGNTDPIGKTLDLDDNLRPRTLTVVAVFLDPPPNSSFDWQLIYRFEPSFYTKRPWMAEHWISVNCQLFAKIRPGTDLNALNQALPEFEKNHIPNATFNQQEMNLHELISLSMISLKDYHLFSRERGQTPQYVWVSTYALIAVIILGIACFNFVNLGIARASERGREVALRKVLGAKRSSLIFQFLMESTLLALLGLGMGLLLTELLLPYFGYWVDGKLSIEYIGSKSILPWIGLLLFLVGVLGGLYPAVYLANIRPAAVLHANNSESGTRRGWVRFILVVTQFMVSVVLLVSTTVIYLQTNFAMGKDLGFTKEGLIVVRGLYHKKVQDKREVLRELALSIPGVTHVGFSSAVPGDFNENNNFVRIPSESGSQDLLLGELRIGPDFIETYQAKLLAGRSLQRDRQQDNSTDYQQKNKKIVSILINDLAATKLGYPSPNAAIGQIVQLSKGQNKGMQNAEIVGVLNNFHLKSIKHPIRPMFYHYSQKSMGTMSVRFAGVDGPKILSALERRWKELILEVPFRSEYLTIYLGHMYKQEQRITGLFAFFSGLAVMIACLGLYGLVLMTTKRRSKEIAIRKVLGANLSQVMALVLWQFSRPALVANIAAWPIAYCTMDWWLQSFAYRIFLSPTFFVGASALTLLLAWITVAGQVWRVARVHPSIALRYID
ncbi:MAG: ABC transporter permease [Myxococcales bacterium]|nr:ABC transporter permease [Myxococcales bacterium]